VCEKMHTDKVFVNTCKMGGIFCVPVCVSVCVCVCVSVYVSLCVYMCVCVSVCVFSGVWVRQC